ncbi:MAG: hypothetical protein AAGF07_02310 [Patescibacteria group bacterium]
MSTSKTLRFCSLEKNQLSRLLIENKPIQLNGIEIYLTFLKSLEENIFVFRGRSWTNGFENKHLTLTLDYNIDVCFLKVG